MALISRRKALRMFVTVPLAMYGAGLVADAREAEQDLRPDIGVDVAVGRDNTRWLTLYASELPPVKTLVAADVLSTLGERNPANVWVEAIKRIAR